MQDDNRRKFTRILFKVKTQLEADGQRYDAAKTYILSLGGCLLDIDVASSIAAGIACEVIIVLSEIDDSYNIVVSGTVVRADDTMIAVKFNQIDPESLFHLQNVIRYNAPDVDAIEEEIEKNPGVM